MKKRDYENLQACLCSTLCSELVAFAATDANEGVYAVALDANEDYGDILLCINTEKALKETIATTYPEAGQDHIAGTSGIRFNPGEFAFSKVLELGEAQEKYKHLMESAPSEKTTKKHHEMFSDALAKALLLAAPAFSALNKTSEFVSYHSFHEANTQETERLLRKTIDQELFDRVFPEVAEFRQLMSGIGSLSEEDQVKIWLSLLDSYVTGKPNRYSGIFFGTHGYYDIEKYLVKLGPSAVDAIVDHLEGIVFLPPFNEKGSMEWKRDGSSTRSLSASCTLMFALRHMRNVPIEIDSRLIAILKRLYEESEHVEGVVSLCLLNVARTIHAIWPKRYPPPHEDDSNNRLLNYQRYVRTV